MVDGRTEWATKLSAKLRASLTPGERVTVVRLSPGRGRSTELWTGCWPDYSAAKRDALKRETFVFQRHPLDQIEDQRKFFLIGFGGSLTQIHQNGKRLPAAVVANAVAPVQKDLVRALASDEGRFSQSRIMTRAIIYSDMAEHSDLGSVFRLQDARELDYGRKLGSFLRRSVFYAYGQGEDVMGDQNFQENARIFWLKALRSMTAALGGLGADLNISNSVPSEFFAFGVEVSISDQRLDGRISLLVDRDGTLVDSWIGISRLGAVSLIGTFRCQGTDRSSSCRLDAETTGGLTTNSSSEILVLNGAASLGLSGQIGVKGSNTMFQIKALVSAD